MARGDDASTANYDTNSGSVMFSTIRRVFAIPTTASCMDTQRKRMICIAILSILIAIIVIVPTTVVLTRKTDSTTVKTIQETAMTTEVTAKPETTVMVTPKPETTVTVTPKQETTMTTAATNSEAKMAIKDDSIVRRKMRNGLGKSQGNVK